MLNCLRRDLQQMISAHEIEALLCARYFYASGRFTDEQNCPDTVYGIVGGMALRTSLV